MQILRRLEEGRRAKFGGKLREEDLCKQRLLCVSFPCSVGFAADGDDLWVFKKRKIRSVVCVVGLGASVCLRNGQPRA